MADAWHEFRLGDVARVKHGFAFDGQYFTDERSTDVLVTPGNFAIGGGFKADKLKYYRGPVPDEFVLSPGDLVVTMTDLSKESDTLGYAAIVPRDDRYRYLHNQRIGRVEIHKPDLVDPHFIYWLLRTPEYRSEVLASATGTTVKHTAPGRIEAYRFRAPSIEQQRAVARVLGALEEKIELSHQTNRTLEAMARALFKSWFVDFDPVRARAEGRAPIGMDAATAKLFPDEFVDSELGTIPKRWHAGIMGEVASDYRHMVQPQDLPVATAYIGLEHMPQRNIVLDTWGLARDAQSQKAKFARGDILFGKLRPYFHKVGVAPVDGVCSTDIVVVRPIKSSWFGFTLGHVSSDAFVAFTNAGSDGTRMPRTSWARMAAYPLVVPDESCAVAFTSFVQPLIEKQRLAVFEMNTLARTRDELLPRLLAGDIDASALAMDGEGH